MMLIDMLITGFLHWDSFKTCSTIYRYEWYRGVGCYASVGVSYRYLSTDTRNHTIIPSFTLPAVLEGRKGTFILIFLRTLLTTLSNFSRFFLIPQ